MGAFLVACETTGVNAQLAAGCNLVIQLRLWTVYWQMVLFRLKDKCSLYKSILYQPPDIILTIFGKSFETPLVTGRTVCDGAYYCCLNKSEDIGRNTLRKYKCKNQG